MKPIDWQAQALLILAGEHPTIHWDTLDDYFGLDPSFSFTSVTLAPYVQEWHELQQARITEGLAIAWERLELRRLQDTLAIAQEERRAARLEADAAHLKVINLQQQCGKAEATHRNEVERSQRLTETCAALWDCLDAAGVARAEARGITEGAW